MRVVALISKQFPDRFPHFYLGRYDLKAITTAFSDYVRVRGAIIVFVRILFDVTFLRFFANFEGADGRGAAKKSCEF